jgi:hypothetical protein
LWLGNNPLSQDILPDYRSPYLNSPLYDEYVAKGEIAFMQAKKAESLHYIATYPGSFLKFAWFRFLEMWLRIDQPIGDMLTKYPAKVRMIVSVNLVVVLAGLSGLFLLCRQQREISLPIAIVPLVYPMIYYVTHPSLRYRHPMDTVLIVMAASAICNAVAALTRRRTVHVATSQLAIDVPESR